MPSKNAVPPRRGRFRFTLRTLLVVVTLVACALAVWRSRVNAYAELRERRIAFQEAYKTEAFDKAYAFMTPEYRQEHTLAHFTTTRPFASLPDVADDDVAIGILGREATVYDTPYATWWLLIGTLFYWHKQDGEWYFSDRSETIYD
jgi:hypothetical protein